MRLLALTLLALAGFLAIRYAAPVKELDVDGKILPLARKFAQISDSSDLKPLRGKVIVIMDCSSGIGLSLASIVSKMGAQVIGIGSSQQTVQDMKHNENPSMEVFTVDLMDLASVATTADQIATKWDHIDILVNVPATRPSQGLLKSAQGYNPTFAANYLSHFLLTEKLSAALHSTLTKTPTVVQVTSAFHWQRDGQDLMVRGRDMPVAAKPATTEVKLFRSLMASADAQLAQIYHVRALRRKHTAWSKNPNARVVSACPGWVDTAQQKDAFPHNGWALASVLVAMFDTTLCTEDNCPDYYTNTPAMTLFGAVMARLPWRILDNPHLRFAIAFFLGAIVGHTQNLGYHLGPSETSSPESQDTIIGNALYYWSYGEVSKYL